MNFGTVAILGPGLIGGSLALALAERGLVDKLMIYARSAKALDAIRTAGVDAELTTNPSEAVRDADIVILCVPIEAMAALVHEIRDALKPTALITDVGSVKGSVERDLAPLLDGRALWIGSHPMAGSEQGGFSAARPDLFENAAIVLTPTRHTQPEAESRAEQFWQALGGRIFRLDPQTHDASIAQISHLPHLIAAALVNHATPEARELAGGGFRDTTRVASGSPELWTEILFANSEAMAGSLRAFIAELGTICDLLEMPGTNGSGKAASADVKTPLRDYLKQAQNARSLLLEKKPQSPSRS